MDGEIDRNRQLRAAGNVILQLDRSVTELESENDRLRAAIDVVLRAVDNKGSHPEYHDELRRRHEREWPTLWRAIASMREARRG